MISSYYKNSSAQVLSLSLSLAIFFLTLNACTVKRVPVEPGTIPELVAPTPAAGEFGNTLFKKLQSDYKLDSDNQKKEELVEIFNLHWQPVWKTSHGISICSVDRR